MALDLVAVGAGPEQAVETGRKVGVWMSRGGCLVLALALELELRVAPEVEEVTRAQENMAGARLENPVAGASVLVSTGPRGWEPEMSSPNYSNLSEFLSPPPAAIAEQHQRPSRQQRRARRRRRGSPGIARNGTDQQQLELQGLIVHRLEAISNQMGVLIDRVTPVLFDRRSTTIGRASPVADTASRSRSANLEPNPTYQGSPTPRTKQAGPSNPQQPDNLPFDVPDYMRVQSAGGGGAAAPPSTPQSLLRRRALIVAMLEADLAETRRQLWGLRAVAQYGSAVTVTDAVEALINGLDISIGQDLDRLRSLRHEEAEQQWTTAGLASSTRFARAQPPTPAQAQVPFAPCPSPPRPRHYAASYLTSGCAGAVSPTGSEAGPDGWAYEYVEPEPDWPVVDAGPTAATPEALAGGFCFHGEHGPALPHRRRFVSPVAEGRSCLEEEKNSFNKRSRI
ncbi:hypothetical protein DL766_003600 [Monosporascus sp. MC13-8B]|uniref:Prion-inhibition and propagation HeLo domain-containing protein n=1 Tax=Monosporascus cannonballus TaxID=155416 RepID=A0ABY0HBB9_9PEZI|nr:hypothetical protein DL762_003338 [Monosporascus cannonballus]RYP33168.1 hypothetical protein DL766_003600 [Monosporascus sp. MC13-8B]